MRSPLMLVALLAIASVACSGDSGTCTCTCVGDCDGGFNSPPDQIGPDPSSREDCQNQEFLPEVYRNPPSWYGWACSYSPSASLNAP
jgi:hypothetical protein